MKVAKMVSKELEAESIVVFDEAHNIDSVCIEALSVTLNDRMLEQATRSLGRLSSEVARQKAQDSTRLRQEYENLVNGLLDQGLLNASHSNDVGLASVSAWGLSESSASLYLTLSEPENRTFSTRMLSVKQFRVTFDVRSTSSDL
jgi:Rad3-related DNA helicase